MSLTLDNLAASRPPTQYTHYNMAAAPDGHADRARLLCTPHARAGGHAPLPKSKYLVRRELTVAELAAVLRGDGGLPADAPFHLYLARTGAALDGPALASIAVKLGTTRLIDNVPLL